MKKTLLSVAFLSAISSAAHAEDAAMLKPYVGASYQYTHIDYGNDNKGLAANNLNGADIHAGLNIGKNFGVEAGYNQSLNSTKHNVMGTGLDTKISLGGFTFDALGYLPVTNKIDLIGTAGVALIRERDEVVGVATDTSWKTKGRIGGGAQYALTDNSNVRLLVRYQDYSDGDNGILTNLGFNYKF